MNSIDSSTRRRLLAEAVWRVIRRDGFDAASVRNVADAAGLSAGSVRHFFPTQQALHVFAMDALTDEVTQRSSAAAEAQDEPRDAVRAVLVELLPLSDRTHDDYLAHLQFVVRATVDPALAPTARDGLYRLQEAYRRAIASLATSGDLTDGVDQDEAAQRLGILMDGLVLRLLVSPELLTRRAAAAQLDAFLAEICSSRR